MGVRIDSAAAGLLLFSGCENAEPMAQHISIISCHMGLAVRHERSFQTPDTGKHRIETVGVAEGQDFFAAEAPTGARQAAPVSRIVQLPSLRCPHRTPLPPGSSDELSPPTSGWILVWRRTSSPPHIMTIAADSRLSMGAGKGAKSPAQRTRRLPLCSRMRYHVRTK